MDGAAEKPKVHVPVAAENTPGSINRSLVSGSDRPCASFFARHLLRQSVVRNTYSPPIMAPMRPPRLTGPTSLLQRYGGAARNWDPMVEMVTTAPIDAPYCSMTTRGKRKVFESHDLTDKDRVTLCLSWSVSFHYDTIEASKIPAVKDNDSSINTIMISFPRAFFVHHIAIVYTPLRLKDGLTSQDGRSKQLELS